jgi:putative ABC transport system ATP-binding protein
MEALISVAGVTKYAAGRDKNTYMLKDITFQIKTGDFIAITGPAGAEKTALLRLLCLRDRPDKGGIFLTGIDTCRLPRGQRKNISRHVFGTVFRDDKLYSRISVLKNIALPLVTREKNPGEAFDKSREILKEFGMETTENKKAGELTDEQKKMSIIARAVVKAPGIIIADELTGELTDENGMKAINYFKKISEAAKVTMIIATSDDRIIKQANKIIQVYGGMIKSC